MTRKEFIDKFFDLCKDAKDELPPNLIAEILRDYTDGLDQMKKIFSFYFAFLLFFSPLVALADNDDLTPQEEIAELPLPYQMSEEAITYLLGEDMYQGTLSWQGNKVSTKFNYDMNQEKQIDGNIRIFSFHWICSVLVLPKLGEF